MNLTSFRAIHAAFACILLASAACVAGCGGSKDGGGSTTPAPSATITDSTSSMNAGAAQTVTATVTNPNPAVTCGFNASTGSFGSATLSGNTCTAVYTAPTTITSVTTATLTFTGGGATAAASVTVNPVAQSISLQSTLNVGINGTLALTASSVTASASCSPSAVTLTVSTMDSVKTTTGGQLASWTADSTNATFGMIHGGNTFSQNSQNTYTVTAKCGTATSNTATLTVTDPKATLVSISPTTVKSTSSYTQNWYTNDNSYMTGNWNSLSNQWYGTEAGMASYSCADPRWSSGWGVGDSTAWVGPNQVQGQYARNGSPTGSYSAGVHNPPTANGTGGGMTCIDGALIVTANTSTVIGENILVTVDLGTKTKAGTLSVITNGVTKSYPLGLGAGEPVAMESVVYVPNMYSHTISALNTDSSQISLIPNGATIAPFVMTTDGKSLYFAAEVGVVSPQVGIYRLEQDNSATLLAIADGFSGFAAKDGKLLWTATREGSGSADLNVLDTATGVQHSVPLSSNADSVAVLSDGSTVVWQTREKHVSLMDTANFREVGTASFAKGILNYHDNAFALADGTVNSLAASGSKLTWSSLGALGVEDIYNGFAITRANGAASLVVAHKATTGPVAHTVTIGQSDR